MTWLGRARIALASLVIEAVPAWRHPLALAATHRGEVHAFRDAALPAGGRNNSFPGVLPRHHENYYAAYVFDPDRTNIEAVSSGRAKLRLE